MTTALYANCPDCNARWDLWACELWDVPRTGMMLPFTCPRCGELLTVWEASGAQKEISTLDDLIARLLKLFLATDSKRRRRVISTRLAQLWNRRRELRKQESTL